MVAGASEAAQRQREVTARGILQIAAGISLSAALLGRGAHSPRPLAQRSSFPERFSRRPLLTAWLLVTHLFPDECPRIFF